MALRLAFLLVFLIASNGTHEAAATMQPENGAASMTHGADRAKGEASPCPHRDGGKAATGCCLAGPCKLALPWRDPPPLGRPLPVPRFVLPVAAPAEALPAAPWRPPA